MASASVDAPPRSRSPYDIEYPAATDSAGDSDEALCTAISASIGSGSAAGGVISSPASYSLGSSWAVLGQGGLQSPGILSQASPHSGTSLDQSGNAVFGDSTHGDVNFLAQGLVQNPQDLWVPGEFEAAFDAQFNDFGTLFPNFGTGPVLDGQQPLGVPDFDNPQPLQSGIDVPPWEPLNLRGANDIASNNIATGASDIINNNATPPSLGEISPIFVIEDPSFTSPSPSQQYSPSALSASISPPPCASPVSPAQPIKQESTPEQGRSPTNTTANKPPATAAIPIRKVNNANRVQKRKAPTATNSSSSPIGAATAASSSASSTTTANKFLIVTPSSISLHADKPNPFECFEALAAAQFSSSGSSSSSSGSPPAASARPSQRGRKGPLANDTKQSALQVRRMGACFCCHARKVRCDQTRPCRNCVRLAAQVPQAVCWQFADFTGVLFPEFIRGHLRREEVAKFVRGNIESFTVGGAELPCTVQLFSGIGFKAVLEVKAKFFTAKTPDVLQHWHMQMGGNSIGLYSRGAAPIGLDMGIGGGAGEGKGKGSPGSSDGGGWDAQRSELKKSIKGYVYDILEDPRYAALMTPPPQHTELPRKILRIVHDYAQRCDAPMVRRALSIYTMHFIMTRHLCLTQRTIADLEPTGLVPQGVPWVTPRVLNRQIKAVVDEMLCREMQALFDNFSKSLKPKVRREWAPCLASFLVLCLFMESVETAADMFVISDNEINLRHHYAPTWKRSFVLDVNSQIENMPFKQFAFQFHQIYQTHSRDAGARSFNPLLDDGCFEQAELDRDAADMVRKLRRFIDEDWSELDYLTADPILPNIEDHPYPRNVSYNYTGRLVAKFLLSFTDEKYIFDNKSY
ncbi:hypothetical protein VTK26DRAFT_105 [Humicola hyalothermophila]